MLKRCIQAEWLKLRHSRMWLILVVLPVFSVLIGCANYYFNQAVLQNGWYSLWTQVSLFYGQFFLPVLIAICSAYVCRLEHMNRNWNAVMTAPVSVASIFASKLVIVGLLLLFVQLFFIALYFGAGKLFGLQQPFPLETVGWIIRGWFASLAIGAIQLRLSMQIRSFAIPIGISVCAVFIGLGMYVMKLGLYFPYSLLTIGMGVISQESLSASDRIRFWTMCILFIVIVAGMTIRRLKKVDVTA
ncbi:ABC transporter permease [Paenibacillus radicis (ex Gao et al. 2016)]|uniref:Multidrug ABC transporter permease n=1 Tax=Paenibacillus radicis (ex Gao et al. 2016) TaxID=1737354 RepID=A0A917HTC1_9BACL|nr:ABC transporter permease [Paenibacillus radicis (ex Gao et al. 2016)]GGG88521.1 multidrug ABC transporter permease [Paenibacillus radicis (ex Gao et al. 2016)]